MANRVTLTMSEDKMNKRLSQMRPVQNALRAHAKKVAAAGEALLAAHRKTGAHKVEYQGHDSTVEYGHIDHYVVLTGPAPISVEFGHRAENGKWVQGLYIMTRAMTTR